MSTTDHTSEDNTMIPAYKGFNRDLTCRGWQYAEGETYQTEDIIGSTAATSGDGSTAAPALPSTTGSLPRRETTTAAATAAQTSHSWSAATACMCCRAGRGLAARKSKCCSPDSSASPSSTHRTQSGTGLRSLTWRGSSTRSDAKTRSGATNHGTRMAPGDLCPTRQAITDTLEEELEL